ncbi:hypothetical protein D9611_008543 [Ephemerocybe angulata]|uniref:Uncharacterized protein n=1 Tax=Ephemerocybe angulata TaxID=980116 RepID=A0A8H5AYX0_9AGAR|nr:hypothetical protein D9611_014791 [Tulosesus angulatus]KAF5313500.1 hypothetical protein D9611_008543 [Tulosesus angulatus]
MVSEEHQDTKADVQVKMMSHNTLYSLANALGILSMITAVSYHIISVNAETMSKDYVEEN